MSKHQIKKSNKCQAESAYYRSTIFEIHFSIFQKIIESGKNVPLGTFNSVNDKQPAMQCSSYRCLIYKHYSASSQLSSLLQIALGCVPCDGQILYLPFQYFSKTKCQTPSLWARRSDEKHVLTKLMSVPSCQKSGNKLPALHPYFCIIQRRCPKVSSVSKSFPECWITVK